MAPVAAVGTSGKVYGEGYLVRNFLKYYVETAIFKHVPVLLRVFLRNIGGRLRAAAVVKSC